MYFLQIEIDFETGRRIFDDPVNHYMRKREKINEIKQWIKIKSINVDFHTFRQ